MLQANSAPAQIDIGTGEPFPTGSYDVPNEPFDIDEHRLIHSSLPLQGHRDSELFAPVMYGPYGRTVAGFQTAVIVNNPDPTDVTVTLDYWARDGVFMYQTLATIPAKATLVESAFLVQGGISSGNQPYAALGMVHVTTEAKNRRVTGGVIHYAEQTLNPLSPFGTVVLDLERYLSTMQPLQPRNPKKSRSFFGPIPVRNPGDPASANLPSTVTGLFSFVNLVNPNPVPNKVEVVVKQASDGSVVESQTVVVAPYGAHQVIRPFRYSLERLISPGGGPYDDLTVTATSLNELPILGELLMMDFDVDYFTTQVGQVNSKANMVSVAGADLLSKNLVNPELVQTFPMNTAVGIANMGEASVPVNVTYYGDSGNVLGTDLITVSGMGSAMIATGSSDTPNFPSGTPIGIERGWIDVTGNSSTLVGWSVRGTGFDNVGHSYGELLHGNSLIGHQRGWLEGGLVRTNAPLAFDLTSSEEDPGYIAFVNDSVSNIGAYRYDFWLEDGTPAGGLPFLGVPYLRTSRTYEDAVPNSIINNQDDVHHGQVSYSTGRIKGIATIGGALLGRIYGEIFGYPGPGDILEDPGSDPTGTK